MQLMVEQMGTCHLDAVRQTCCKPKSLGCELKLDCGHTALSSTMVNPTACLQEGLCNIDKHGEEQWEVRGCDLTPTPPVTGKIELNTNIFSGE